MGCDLSLRSSGLAILPCDWALDWKRVRGFVSGCDLKQDSSVDAQIGRMVQIRDDILAAARTYAVTHAFVLGYAYNKQQVSRAHSAGELGGVVKVALVEANIEVHVVVESQARTLLGKAPRKDAKLWATQRLMRAGAPRHWAQDCLDAFVAANFGSSELGGDTLIMPGNQ